MSDYLKILSKIDAHNGDVNSVCFNENSTLLASASSDKSIKVYRIGDVGSNGYHDKEIKELVHLSNASQYPIYSLDFTAGNKLVSGGMEGELKVWDAETGDLLSSVNMVGNSGIRVCRFSPDGRRVVVGLDDHSLVIVSLQRNYVVQRFTGHDGSVVAAAFSPDDNFVASGSTNGDIRIWDAAFGHGKCLVSVLDGHDLGVTSCQFKPHWTEPLADGHVQHTLLTSGYDNNMKLWRFCIKVGHPVGVLELKDTLAGHSAPVLQCTFSYCGSLIASASVDRDVRVWNANKGQCLLKLAGHTRYVTCCSLTACPDDTDALLLATGSNDRSIRLWHVRRVAALLANTLHPFEVRDAAAAKSLKRPATADNAAIEDVRFSFATNRNGSVDSVAMPNEFFCPITHDLMTDPVVACDGYSYERMALVDWLSAGHNRSPMTNQPLTTTVLTPNLNLRSLIQKSWSK